MRLSPRNPIVRLLLLGGVVAPPLYAATVIWGATLFPGYSHLADPISSLTQSGRAGAAGIDALFLAYNGLVALYALGGILVSHGRRSWLWSFALVLVAALAGLLMWPFPQDPMGAPPTTAGTVHLVLAAIASFATMGAIGAAILAWRGARRPAMLWFSACALAVVFVSGAFAALAAAGGWPGFGLVERITIGSFELWLLVTAARALSRAGLD